MLGGLTLWAAIYKAWNPNDAVALVGATLTQRSPEQLLWVAVGVEWIVGVFLLSGWRARWALALFLGFVTALSAVLFAAMSKGFEGSCGCFGLAESAGGALVRNGVLACVAMVAFVLPASGATPRCTLAEGACG